MILGCQVVVMWMRLFIVCPWGGRDLP
jgi:hypothetical protein